MVSAWDRQRGPPPLRGDEPAVVEMVRRALEEDRARHDVTTGLLGSGIDLRAEGRLRAETALVVAGVPVAARAFLELDASCETIVHVVEGVRADPGRVIATVRGPARALLSGERVALNFLQRLSGIATATRAAADALEGTAARVTDTRKTTPGLRYLEKYAVRVGGGASHRDSLADAVLWKDNHWALLNRTGESLTQALRRAPAGLPVIVEVESERQLEQALAAGVTRILVDNQAPERVAEWVRRAGPGVAIEASGGITPGVARAYAEAGARFISMGALTHSVSAVAITLEVAFEA